MARGDGCEFLIFNILKRLESVPADPLEIVGPEKHGSPLLWRKPLPWLLQMGEGSSISSIPNKTQHKILETKVMVKF